MTNRVTNSQLIAGSVVQQRGAGIDLYDECCLLLTLSVYPWSPHTVVPDPYCPTLCYSHRPQYEL